VLDDESARLDEDGAREDAATGTELASDEAGAALELAAAGVDDEPPPPPHPTTVSNELENTSAVMNRMQTSNLLFCLTRAREYALSGFEW
jgi:hypothetical protein